MKTKYIIMIAALAIAASCNRGYKSPINAKLKNADDSICFAMGTMTGVQLGQFIDAQNDSLDGRTEVLKGIRKGINDKNQYAKYGVIGQDIARTIRGMEKSGQGLLGDTTMQFDKQLFVQGIINALADDPDITTMEEQAPMDYMNNFMEQQQKQRIEAEYGQYRTECEQFLQENKHRDKIITTQSGLQYEILKKGYGPRPKLTDNVRVHYHGTLIDGTVFDSSVERGEPADFGLMGVIQGWQEVLQLMPVGSKWRVYIPQQLAYGDRQTGNVKPFSALIFDIELIKILDPKDQK